MTISHESGALMARLRTIDEHIRFENIHDVDGIIGTFGETAFVADEAWGERHTGHGGVRSHYEQLISAVPDLAIEVLTCHPARDSVILEVTIRGTHLGTWRGLPGTGRKIQIPLCAVFTFDRLHKLTSEKIYYDRATVLRQIGVLHEPESIAGRILTMLFHPLTLARAISRKIFRI